MTIINYNIEINLVSIADQIRIRENSQGPQKIQLWVENLGFKNDVLHADFAATITRGSGKEYCKLYPNSVIHLPNLKTAFKNATKLHTFSQGLTSQNPTVREICKKIQRECDFEKSYQNDERFSGYPDLAKTLADRYSINEGQVDRIQLPLPHEDYSSYVQRYCLQKKGILIASQYVAGNNHTYTLPKKSKEEVLEHFDKLWAIELPDLVSYLAIDYIALVNEVPCAFPQVGTFGRNRYHIIGFKLEHYEKVAKIVEILRTSSKGVQFGSDPNVGDFLKVNSVKFDLRENIDTLEKVAYLVKTDIDNFQRMFQMPSSFEHYLNLI